ncbi:MAG: NAD(P)/FAD-dependent oxidoreductase [Gammaproteobacteria bacterium]
MNTMTYDVVIIGGGLAGLSTAATIAQGSDAAIAIVEERGIGSNNPTPMTFTDVVERFSLVDYVTARYRRFTFHSVLGNKSSHVYDTSPLVTFDYRRACGELLRRAQLAGNVTLIRDRAMQLRRGFGDGWQVCLAGGQEITASLLVDASGCSLFTTHALDLPRPRMFSHCFGQTFSKCAVPDLEEAFFLAPSDRFGDGGGWLYPLFDGRVSFGYATLSTAADYPAQMMKERYYRALREFMPYADWLADAQLDHVEMGTIPVCPPRSFVYDGLMLVGDAAGQATIWSCMGSEPSLVGGQLAGQTVIKAHRRQDYSLAVLENYQRQWNQMYRRIYRQGALLAPVSWRQGEINWNRQIPLVQQLTPTQMLARLRINWPLLPWWKIALICAYDWAGRARRGLLARLRGQYGQRSV